MRCGEGISPVDPHTLNPPEWIRSDKSFPHPQDLREDEKLENGRVPDFKNYVNADTRENISISCH